MDIVGSELFFFVRLTDWWFGCGDNSMGQLGLGDTQPRYTLTQTTIPSSSHVICDDNTTWFVTSDHELWATGYNSVGQLGTDSWQLIETTPQFVMADVAEFCSSAGASYAITTGGRLLVWGNNQYGQLGLDSFDPIFRKPVLTPHIAVEGVKCWPNHAAITTATTLLCAGLGSNGQLGLGNRNTTRRFTPALAPVAMLPPVALDFSVATSTTCLAVGYNGTWWSTSNWLVGTVTGLGWQKIPLANVARLVANDQRAIALLTDGSVWLCGNFEPVAEQWLRMTTSQCCAVALSPHTAWLITTTGQLLALGSTANKHGRFIPTNLGNVPVLTAPTLVELPSISVVAGSAGNDHVVVLSAAGDAWGIGSNEFGQLSGGGTIQFSSWTLLASNVVAVACAADHTLLLMASGDLWGCGDNSRGQLLPTSRPIGVPILTQIAANVASCATSNSHSVVARRDGTTTVLGNQPQWPTTVTATSVAALENLTVVTTDSEFWAGGDLHGHGLPWPAAVAGPVRLGNTTNSAGSSIWSGCNTFVGKASGNVCVVPNRVGAQALGMPAQFATTYGGMPVVAWDRMDNNLKIASIVGTDQHTLVLTEDHQVWGCGLVPNLGAVPTGTPISQNFVTELVRLALPPISAIAATNNCSFFTKADGSGVLVAASDNSNRQIPTNTNVIGLTNLAIPGVTQVVVANFSATVDHVLYRTPTTWFACGAPAVWNSSYNRPHVVPMPPTAIGAVTQDFAVFLRNGQLWGIGSTKWEQFGTTTTTSGAGFVAIGPPNVRDFCCGETFVAAVCSDNSLWYCGVLPTQITVSTWTRAILPAGKIGQIAGGSSCVWLQLQDRLYCLGTHPLVPARSNSFITSVVL